MKWYDQLCVGALIASAITYGAICLADRHPESKSLAGYYKPVEGWKDGAVSVPVLHVDPPDKLVQIMGEPYKELSYIDMNGHFYTRGPDGGYFRVIDESVDVLLSAMDSTKAYSNVFVKAGTRLIVVDGEGPPVKFYIDRNNCYQIKEDKPFKYKPTIPGIE